MAPKAKFSIATTKFWCTSLEVLWSLHSCTSTSCLKIPLHPTSCLKKKVCSCSFYHTHAIDGCVFLHNQISWLSMFSHTNFMFQKYFCSNKCQAFCILSHPKKEKSFVQLFHACTQAFAFSHPKKKNPLSNSFMHLLKAFAFSHPKKKNPLSSSFMHVLVGLGLWTWKMVPN